MIDDDHLESLAQLTHEAYLALTADSSKGSEARVPWDGGLDPKYKDQNRNQVQHQLEELRYLGYVVIPLDRAGQARPFEPADHLDALAIREHTRWMTIAIENGYRAGSERVDDGTMKSHPDIRRWDELDEETREKDRRPWRLLPEHLASVGLRAVVGTDLVPP